MQVKLINIELQETQYYFCATLVLIKPQIQRKKKLKGFLFCCEAQNIALQTIIRWVSSSGLAEAASSPVQSCLLFSVMKINETVQSSAEATGALLTEEAFRLRQPFPARYHGTSERGRKGGGRRAKGRTLQPCAAAE